MIATCPPCYLVVLAGLQQKKVLAPQDVVKMKEDPQYMLLNLILDYSKKSPEDVATTAEVLETFGCKKEAAMLKCKLVFVFILQSWLLHRLCHSCTVAVSHENTDTTCTTRFTHTMSCTSSGWGEHGTMHAYGC